MAYLGMSEDFDLDDDGILRDSASSTGGFLIDNDGIVRDDLDLFKNTGHWTDSGFGGDKQSSTSTLRQFQASFDEDSHFYDVDQSVNISDLEASKDDLSFEGEPSRGNTPIGIVSNRSSLEKPPGFQNRHDTHANQTDFDKNEILTEEYYEQLRDLGVLVDSGDLTPRDSVQVFEPNCSADNLDETAQTDTIADFFRKENERQLQEQQVYRSRDRPISAESSQTVSSQSFPEVSPEEALMLYRVNRHNSSAVNHSFEYDAGQRSVDSTGLFHQDGDTSGIFHRSGDDDEIFLITSRMGVKDHGSEHSENVTPAPYSPHSSRPASRGSVYSSRSQTPYREELNHHSTSLTDVSNLRTRRDQRHTPLHDQNSTSLTDISHFDHRKESSFADVTDFEKRKSPVLHQTESPLKKENRPQLQTRSSSATPHQNKSRPSSVASHRSTVSEAPTDLARSESSKSLSKAKSEESFFEGNKTPRSPKDKMPKRLLPKPAAEDNQSFKMKSKSQTNISNRPGPLKPTHMSMSDITRFEEGMEEDGDRSHGELSVKLKQEHQKRKQATELVQQLQKDYDSLLSKYALAELTIDHMRLGAKVKLHADSPTPNQIQTGSMSPAQQPQVIQMGHVSRAVVANSPSSAQSGFFSPQPDNINRDNRSPFSGSQVSEARSVGRSDRGVGDSRRTSISEGDDRRIVTHNVGAEKVKTNLLHQARGLNERIESFNSLLEQRQLNLDEQEEVFENIRTDHEKLRRHYLQAKEDYNVLRRSGASMKDANFDDGKQLEGELFRLGMKFDDVHANVDTNLKEKSANRQPFQSNRVQDSMDQSDDEGDEHAVDQLKIKMQGTLAGSDVVPLREDVEFEQKLQRLHDEYNALMDRYRRLKQMAKTPERDKEIDNLVRKLKQICEEAPDMFRLAPELEERWDRMQSQENRGGSRGQSPQPGVTSPGAYFLSGNDSQKVNRQQGRRTPDYRSDDSLRTRSDMEYSDTGSRSHGGGILKNKTNGNQGNSRKDTNSPRDQNQGRYSPGSRDRRSPIQNGRSASPGVGYSPIIKGPQPGTGRPGLNRSRERLVSDGRDTSNLSLPRPRRHSHEFKDHKMKKLPDGSEVVSLDDSGISDQEQGALANLPGPGKFKQMTRQRGADDVDSGFIGSVVGSDVSQFASRQSPQQQQQQSLRLRHPGGSHHDQIDGRKRRADAGTSARHDSDSSMSQTRSRSQRDSESERRDSSMQNDSMDVAASFMDDATETEFSESDRSQRSQGQRIVQQGKRNNQRIGQHDHTLEGYSAEEDTDATPKPTTKTITSQNSDVSKPPSPSKAHRQSRTVVSEGEGEITPRATPTRGMTRSRYPSSSDMDTPRGAHNRQGQPSRSRTLKSPSVSQVERSEEHQMKGRELLMKKNLQQKREERGVGSDREIDRGHESDATRVSSFSSNSRLRALQEEVERLKDRVERTVENPPQPPPPPPSNQPEYYDPFDDPYGFMRMPRRRANSFSGAPARDWDEWYWTLPQNRQHDGSDIPLGYAAADAYADVPPPAAQDTSARSRLRRRRLERMKKQNVETGGVSQGLTGPTVSPAAPHPAMAHPHPGVAHPHLGVPHPHPGVPHPIHSAAHPEARPAGHPEARTPGSPGGVAPQGEGPGLYEYYVPSRYSTRGMRQQIANRGYFQTPSGAKIYANDATVPQSFHPGQYVHPHPHPHPHPHLNPQAAYAGTSPTYMGAQHGYQSDTGAMHASAGTKRPFYTIKRSSQGQRVFPQARPRSTVHAQQSYSDFDSLDGRSGYQTDPGIWTGSQTRRVRSYVVESMSCPLCGGSGEHTHAEFEHDRRNLQYNAREYVDDRSRIPRQRSRSFSSARSRYDSPERGRYVIREFRASSTDDSDEEFLTRRRSRSLSRTRRKARKYHKVRGYHSDADALDDSVDMDLNESLNLSEDIGRLTRKMLHSVRGELRGLKRRDRYGSSYW